MFRKADREYLSSVFLNLSSWQSTNSIQLKAIADSQKQLEELFTRMVNVVPNENDQREKAQWWADREEGLKIRNAALAKWEAHYTQTVELNAKLQKLADKLLRNGTSGKHPAGKRSR